MIRILPIILKKLVHIVNIILSRCFLQCPYALFGRLDDNYPIMTEFIIWKGILKRRTQKSNNEENYCVQL